MAFSVNCLHLKFVGYAYMAIISIKILKEFCRKLRFYFTCLVLIFRSVSGYIFVSFLRKLAGLNCRSQHALSVAEFVFVSIETKAEKRTPLCMAK
jgi:hypothetical protein